MRVAPDVAAAGILRIEAAANRLRDAFRADDRHSAVGIGGGSARRRSANRPGGIGQGAVGLRHRESAREHEALARRHAVTGNHCRGRVPLQQRIHHRQGLARVARVGHGERVSNDLFVRCGAGAALDELHGRG